MFFPFLCFPLTLLSCKLDFFTSLNPSIELALSPFSPRVLASRCISNWSSYSSVSKTSYGPSVVGLTRKEKCCPPFSPLLVHLFTQSLSTVLWRVSACKAHVPTGTLGRWLAEIHTGSARSCDTILPSRSLLCWGNEYLKRS